MHSFRLCATLLIKKLEGHRSQRSMTFCDLVTICDTWFDAKFYKKQILSLRT